MNFYQCCIIKYVIKKNVLLHYNKIFNVIINKLVNVFFSQYYKKYKLSVF